MAAKKSGIGRWLLGCFVLIVALAALCCCGGLVMTMFFPAVLVSFFLESSPLPGPTTAPDPVATAAVRSRVCAELAASGETRLSPEDLAHWVVTEDDPKVTVVRLGASGDELSLDLSISTGEVPPQWFNLQMQGAMTLENGWFTDLRFSRAVFSGFDATAFLSQQQLAQQGNQSLANERAKTPDVASFLDSIALLKVENGALLLKLDPGGVAMDRLCADP